MLDTYLLSRTDACVINIITHFNTSLTTVRVLYTHIHGKHKEKIHKEICAKSRVCSEQARSPFFPNKGASTTLQRK